MTLQQVSSAQKDVDLIDMRNESDYRYWLLRGVWVSAEQLAIIAKTFHDRSN